MSSLLEILGSSALFAAAIRLALPVFFAALGEVFAERAGLVNVGLEGMMLAGAFGGVYGAYLTGSPIAGAAMGVLFALVVAAVQSFVAINLGGNQIVAGIALNIVALGATAFLARTIWEGGDVPQVAHFDALPIPVLSDVPVLGPIVFDQNALVYLAGVLAIRWQAMMICGALAGLGGVFLSLGELFTFTDNMSGGRGYIALAVVIIARWKPSRVIWAALLFGVFEAIAFRVQATGADIPYELMLALPYVMTLLVYAGVVGRVTPPATLGRVYTRS